MAFVEINPRYRDLLARQGLTTAADFLALQGVVCCGHPDRNVARVTVGTGNQAVPAILKREHRTRWRDRLGSALAGFGFASKSRREYAMLRMLEAAGIGCPEAIAVGEDGKGRAFLLLREIEGCEELRQFLGGLRTALGSRRRGIAAHLGAALARLHNAGFEHADLYSKHVLVKSADRNALSFFLVDWQRARCRRRIGWSARWRDLAALDATLADELAGRRDRLDALAAYVRAASEAPRLATAAREIRGRARRLLERRRIREMRQPAMASGSQNLIWLDGEALQVTREFRDELGGQMPKFLPAKKGSGFFSEIVALPGSRLAHLVSRWASQPRRWLWAWLRRQPLVAPELESMKVHFRLQRYGVVLPRLLAAGQKNVTPWQIESFLLTEPLPGAVPLARFLKQSNAATRREAVCRSAQVLRQMHHALCYVETNHHTMIGDLLTVCFHAKEGPTVALNSVQGIEKSHHPNPMRAQKDLAAIAAHLMGTCRRTELLRGLLEYIGRPRLTPATRLFAHRVLRRLPRTKARRRVAA